TRPGGGRARPRRPVLASPPPGNRAPPRLLRPPRGPPLVYPAPPRGHGLVTLAGDGRVCFVVPFAGRSLVGTTEVETASPPADTERRPAPEEIRYPATLLHRLRPQAPHTPPTPAY